jgi:hypothetical protein
MPNPNNGVFTVKVKLNKKRKVQLLVVSLAGAEMYRKEISDNMDITELIQLPASRAAGIYLLRVLTEDDVRDVKVVVGN